MGKVGEGDSQCIMEDISAAEQTDGEDSCSNPATLSP